MSRHVSRPYQVAAGAAVRAAWAGGMARPAYVLPTGEGKGHPLDTEVPTTRGLVLWGDLRVGDRVFGSDGAPVAVTAVYDRGGLSVFRVLFSDGTSVITDADHLWQVRDRRYRRTSREHVVIDTAALAACPDLKLARGWRYGLPMIGEVDRIGVDLPLDPYVVGALIANGGLTSNGTQLTTPDLDVVARVSSVVEAVRINDATEGVCPRWNLPGLRAVTLALGLRVPSRNKRIPRIYLESTSAQRWDLLRGLLDGDAHSRVGDGGNYGRRSVTFSTMSPGLSIDIAELVASLGGTCRTQKPRDRDGELVSTILLPVGTNPFGTERKGEAPRVLRPGSPKRSVVAVEPAGTAQVRCISVDAANGLYAVTRNYVITHNTQVIAAEIVEPWLADNPGRRALVVAHRRELIDQAAERLRSAIPGTPVGVVMAGRNDTLPRVLVGSVQTLAGERRRAMLRNVGLVVVDEAHRGVAASYVSLLRHFGAFDGRCVAVGCTATMSRSDDLALGDVWQDVVFRRTIGQAIRGEGNDGIPTLVRPIGIRVTVDGLDLRRVKVSRGDYADGDLGRALSDSMAPKKIAEAWLEHAGERQGIAFAPTVDSAREIMEALNAVGVAAALVHGGTPDRERTAALDAFRAGSVAVLCNCAVFTEGTDLPMASVVVIARPTKHSGLYIQMVGRALRLWPGKADALVLDVAGAAARHSLDARVELFGVEVAEALEAPEVDPLDVEPELIIETGVEGLGAPVPEYADGALSYEIIDLFAGSDTAWSRTPRGVWYFPGAGRFVALVPGSAGGIDVVSVDRWKSDCWPIALNVASLAEAQRVGEVAIAPGERLVSQRGRSWRSSRPTAKTLAYASRIGLTVPHDAHAGEVSEMITEAEARKRLDDRLLLVLPWITYG